MKNSYKFFQNNSCEYFPCHSVESTEEFNCLFCFCPLYFMGKECGGDFSYSEKGLKNCAGCTKPHLAGSGYNFVIEKLKKQIKGDEAKC